MMKYKNVLILDDHPMHLKLLERSLRNLDIENISCHTQVDSALKWIAHNPVDLIFCDLSMPDKDGIDLLLELDSTGYKGLVALVSAMDVPILNTVKSMCQGFSFHLVAQITKPFKQEQLQDALKATVRMANKRNRGLFSVTDEELLVALINGEIVNFYQPQVLFEDEDMIGVEALARWKHPQKGVLFPNIFMPIVERCQLSSKLFDVVMSNAIKDIKSGHLPENVSINVDQFNLENSSFSDNVLQRCREHDIDPKRITIEITEVYSYKRSMPLFKNLAKLRVNGVNVSIDDFGTGYSSLSNLSTLPFNEIKIDRSFVFGSENDKKKQNIITFICDLAKELGIKIVAEGVETKAAWDLLKRLKVDICQGYYISKPVPVNELYDNKN